MEPVVWVVVTLLALPIVLVVAYLPWAGLFAAFIGVAVYLWVWAWFLGGPEEGDDPDRWWDPARQDVARVWLWVARWWHGYEVVGLEKIPDASSSGPALLVYYHSAFPIDFFYLVMEAIRNRRRPISLIVDKFVTKLSMFRRLVQVYGANSGSVEQCVDALNRGNNLAIAPGGVYEGLFSDNTYPVLWRRRTGFARVALEAKVPIIPVFTRNCQEVFRTPPYKKYEVVKWGYLFTRFPLLMPIYGGFPVKLKTFIGDPIPYDPSLTAEELAAKTKAAMEELIRQHQRLPGSIERGLRERWTEEKSD